VKRIVLLLATGLGLGLSPVAPGTVGTLLGVLIVIVTAGLGVPWQVALAVTLAALSIPICGHAEKHFGKKDDHRIVADEYLTFYLCVIGLPWAVHPWLLALAFVTHRLFDIVKPPPAYRLQSLRGGLGVAVDDIVASLYALGVNHLVWWLVSRNAS